MKNFLLLLLLLPAYCFAQDFSNKGTDFWLAYPAHIDGTTSTMALYISSQTNTSGVVTVPGGTIPFSVTANQATVVEISPATYAVINAQNEGLALGRAIHVTSVAPVVVYSHVLNAARSGSTLVLPTNTLGREYIAVSYRSSGNSTPSGGTTNGSASGSQFTVVAVENNTTIEVTPTAPTVSGSRPVGVPFTVNMNSGDVYQYRTISSQDITGTKIRSLAGTASCKPIAVFSGSSWTSMNCNSASGGDNLFQQLMPKSAWGKNYVTAPFADRQYDIYRVIVEDPTTVVTVNGAVLNTATLVNNYYEFNGSVPNVITSDKRIMVVQYMISQTCDTRNGGSTGANAPFPGDPEMVILNPIEQTINDVTVVSARDNLIPSTTTNIRKHFFTIIMKSNATASLRIDGAPPIAAFTSIGTSGYSYLHENVTASTNTNASHRINADSGFTALAYGMGAVESYGYNAGTNVKDFYQYISLENQYATVNYPATCKNTPFKFSITLPYLATQLTWNFNNEPSLSPNANVTQNNPVPVSTTIVDGRTLYKFELTGNYIFSSVGTFPIKVTAVNPTPDGCTGAQDISYDVVVDAPPAADFSFTHAGCPTDPVNFTDITNSTRPVYKWDWTFGDATTATIKSPVKTYTTTGSFNVNMKVYTEVGCMAEITKPVTIYPKPVASFTVTPNTCKDTVITFTSTSTAAPGTLVKWIWDFGDGNTQTELAGAPVTHSYVTAGPYTVSLTVENSAGCKSVLVTQNITVYPKPLPSFTLPGVCLPSGSAQFTNTTTINGTAPAAGTAYLWNFGDGGTSALQNPPHNFTTAGPFNVSLLVTSANNCQAIITQPVTNIYAQPKAMFTPPAEICLREAINFADLSNGQGNAVNEWHWDFGDGNTSTQQNPAYTYTIADTFFVKLWVKTDKGCLSDTMTKQIIVNPLPLAAYNILPPTCVNTPVTFQNTSTISTTNIVKWNWVFGDGNTNSAINGNNVTNSYATVGNYTTSLQVVSDKGCNSDVTQKPIIINELPEADFILPEVCLSDAFAQFTDNSSLGGSTTVPLSYSWNFGDPNATPATNISTQKNPTHKYTAAANYNVTLTVTSATGCAHTTVKSFTVNGSVPVANAAITNTGNLCSNKDVTLKNLSTVDFGNVTKLEIIWDNGNAPTVIETDDVPAPDKIYTHSYAEFQSPATKNIIIRVRAYSGGSCANEKDIPIVLYAVPATNFAAVPDVCANVPAFQLTQAGESSGLPGSFTYTGAGTNTTGLFTPAIAGAGDHQLIYTYTTTDGCKDADTSSIKVFPVPVVNAGNDLNVLEGGTTTFNPQVSGANIFSYLWVPSYPSNNLSSTTIKNPVFTGGTADISYTLTVKADAGCSASDDINITILKMPVVPNAFSPNADGINDTWEIKYLDTYPGATVQVFNRYGQMVFESRGYAKPWKGDYNGYVLPIGVYYYIINPKNGRKQIAGNVTILR